MYTPALGVQQLARPPVDQAGHINALLVSRALHEIQEVTATWQEMRRQVTGLTVSDLRHRFHGAAAVGGDAQNRAGRIPNEQDSAVAVPAAASAPFARGDRAHQPTIEIHSLQAGSGVNAIDLPSGDQNGEDAPAVPETSVGFTAPTGRIHTCACPVRADERQRRTIRRDRERAEIARADHGRRDDIELLLDVRGWWSPPPDGDSHCCRDRQCRGRAPPPMRGAPSRRRAWRGAVAPPPVPLRILDVEPYIGKITHASADVFAQAAPKQTSKGRGSPRREPLPLRLALEHLGEDLANRAAL